MFAHYFIIIKWCCISWPAMGCLALYISTSYRMLVIHTYLITINGVATVLTHMSGLGTGLLFSFNEWSSHFSAKEWYQNGMRYSRHIRMDLFSLPRPTTTQFNPNKHLNLKFLSFFLSFFLSCFFKYSFCLSFLLALAVQFPLLPPSPPPHHHTTLKEWYFFLIHGWRDLTQTKHGQIRVQSRVSLTRQNLL